MRFTNVITQIELLQVLVSMPLPFLRKLLTGSIAISAQCCRFTWKTEELE
uniref:Uncharacterized protein n=1 Tax=Arundo donax TaxID=35708 RepID=A0A0A9HG32_ARUDO